jgi:Na+/proline symporter
MNLSIIDTLIILGYLSFIIFFGFWLSKKASASLQSYFLGGNTIKWYFLGLSNGSGMYDVSGTAWTVAILYIYGVKSAWLPWLWPVWNQVFIMVFLAIWLRRSNVMTGAEWITTRFGTDRGGKNSHLIVVIFALVSVIGFIAYFFQGIGKFATAILPWDLSFTLGSIHLTSESSYAIIMLTLTTLYTIKGGMYSVVGTEVIQFIILSISSVIVAFLAMSQTTSAQIHAAIPCGWTGFWPGWNLNMDWGAIFPEVNNKIGSDGFGMLGCLVMMMIFKGVFASLAGPVPSFDMQRVLSCKSPKEAAKMSAFTILVLNIPRYLMIAGLTVFGLVLINKSDLLVNGHYDFEKILSVVVAKHIPIGLKGVILAGLLSAFMATFSAFVNAAPAYLVNDLYKRYLNPGASQRKLVKYSYIASFAIVLVGVVAGFMTDSINSMTLWITSSLYGGYAAANVLKWIWWRFNGQGYFWGMLGGLIAATVVPSLVPSLIGHMGYADALGEALKIPVVNGIPQIPAIYLFPVVLLFSFAGSLIGCLTTKPTEMSVLVNFYRKVRPWGFWKPVHQKTMELYPDFKTNASLSRDSFNVVIGIIWQMSMVITPIYFVIKEFTYAGIAGAVALVCMAILKFSWYDKIED